MKPMRLFLVVALMSILAGAATAEPSGLSGAIDRQRQDLTTQQGEMRRETERQSLRLQQQQERNLQYQLLNRQAPPPPSVRPPCTQVGGTLVCR
jgi:hypothetical protein